MNRVKENCAFTIVAKNYIGLGLILEQSIRKYYSDFDFYIVVADEHSSNLPELPHYVLFANKILGINSHNWYNMAFKYDLTEFCTAIKPKSITYLLNQGYSKVIYLDPDIYFFSSLAPIFNNLNRYDIILTPHITSMAELGSSDAPENVWLSCGVFNLGFIAISDSAKSRKMLEWWNQRLVDHCYVEHGDGEYTDQKWINFLPAFFTPDELLIDNNLGMNLAPWNFYEREVIFGTTYEVHYRNGDNNMTFPLMFVHYSGYDYNQLIKGVVFQKNISNINEYKDITTILSIYSDAIRSSQDIFNKTIDSRYTYNYFSDGSPINPYHRRLYRAFCNKNNGYQENPFNSDSLFYKKLKYKKMISSNIDNNVKLYRSSYSKLDSQVKKINKIFRMLFGILGHSRYFLLMRFLRTYSKTEEQIHLLNK